MQAGIPSTLLNAVADLGVHGSVTVRIVRDCDKYF